MQAQDTMLLFDLRSLSLFPQDIEPYKYAPHRFLEEDAKEKVRSTTC